MNLSLQTNNVSVQLENRQKINREVSKTVHASRQSRFHSETGSGVKGRRGGT